MDQLKGTGRSFIIQKITQHLEFMIYCYTNYKFFYTKNKYKNI